MKANNKLTMKAKKELTENLAIIVEKKGNLRGTKC